MRPILGGLGNVDDNVIELPDGAYRGSALRLFDPATGLWSIWWSDSRGSGLQPPVHGRFDQGVGTFFGDDTLRGRPIRVRYIWSDITATSAGVGPGLLAGFRRDVGNQLADAVHARRVRLSRRRPSRSGRNRSARRSSSRWHRSADRPTRVRDVVRLDQAAEGLRRLGALRASRPACRRASGSRARPASRSSRC